MRHEVCNQSPFRTLPPGSRRATMFGSQEGGTRRNRRSRKFARSRISRYPSESPPSESESRARGIVASAPATIVNIECRGVVATRLIKPQSCDRFVPVAPLTCDRSRKGNVVFASHLLPGVRRKQDGCTNATMTRCVHIVVL